MYISGIAFVTVLFCKLLQLFQFLNLFLYYNYLIDCCFIVLILQFTKVNYNILENNVEYYYDAFII